MKVDYISDLHLDFHVSMNHNTEKHNDSTRAFCESLLPDELGEVLIIAGDISHYNRQSIVAIELFSELYEKVFITLGNHDYYLISKNQSKKYNDSSLNREIELHEEIQTFDNVFILDYYTSFQHNGVSFAGSTNWYPLESEDDNKYFYEESNDSRKIKRFDITKAREVQLKCYDELDEADVIVTHVPTFRTESHIKFGDSCYLSIPSSTKAKYYVFGHCHEQGVYEQDGVNYHINALGYPGEWINWVDTTNNSSVIRSFKDSWNKIKSFEI